MDKALLIRRLEGSLAELDALHMSIVVMARVQHIRPNAVLNTKGEPMLLPILTAQANVLSALATLEAI